ncbi:MAG: hypothetical protein D6750_08035 [Bacteroidetes bacterium]|nr:MAG: hypothetical protein D6750_08035 [Bacteroidota bacterium]
MRTGAPPEKSLNFTQLPDPTPLSPTEKAHLEAVRYIQAAISRIRGLMQSFSLQGPLRLHIQTERPAFFTDLQGWLHHFLPLEAITLSDKPFTGPALRILVETDLYFIAADLPEAAWQTLREKLQKELAHVESFLRQLEAKLHNPQFRTRAAPDVIAREEKKLADNQARRTLLLEQLEALGTL